MENEDDFALFLFFFEDPYHNCVKKYEKGGARVKATLPKF